MMVVSRSVALILAAMVGGCGGASGDQPPSATPVPPPAVSPSTPTYTGQVVNEYPHDPESFTQGFVWEAGKFYESTGLEGKSSIREVDIFGGGVRRQRDVPGVFGEGIAILGGKLYQLTWKNGRCIVYDVSTFAPTGQEFRYDGEGWGLTTDGTSLVMSNGSSAVTFRDPKTFAVTRTITVTDNGVPIDKLNELEWVKGELWANVWTSDQIVRIDPATGRVVGWIDVTGLLSPAERAKVDVLNGIVYDVANDRVYVTGKNWPKVFEIRAVKR
ncbi:MAG: glutaminyl-peptide cyclotransferase [Gemmatimonadaceae bacterium]|jgi:glutamine cyclotransferase|nr:glutaminyl-peptide cyclotransferase [Gemmatimonadaceae bacterium]